MPVVVGAPRSGTTLLRLMLDAHPALAIPPETGFLVLAGALTGDGRAEADHRDAVFEALTHYPPEAPAWPDFGIEARDFRSALAELSPFSTAAAFRAFYRLYAGRFNKPRWGDKTPMYCLHIAAIARALPEARFIHVIRDGRDVALSLREMWFAPGRDIETLARHWRDCVTAARAQRQAAPYLEVRFEDLVRDHEAELRRICAFIDLDFDRAMLAYHERVPGRLAEHRTRVGADGRVVVSHEDRLRQQALTAHPPQPARAGAWQRAMSGDEQRRFDAVAGTLMAELGYGQRA